MKKLVVIIAILSITMIACKKEKDSENPVITIFTPTNAQEFESADSVTINFKVEDADLHEVGFTITRASDDSVLYNVPANHIHDNPIVVNEKIKIVVPSHTDAKLSVNAEDHNGNMAIKSVNFHIHPL